MDTTKNITAICVLVFFTAIFSLYGQKECSIWYFGENAGLDFRTGNPEPLLDGKMDTWEGCAVISDDEGNLLFYTNGMNVWNREHQIMPNGDFLRGGRSSSQSSIIVPNPGSPDIYYIFTVDNDRGIYGVRYSIVDMSLLDGIGDIDIKNKNVEILPDKTLMTEKITAVKHANGKSIWVITHQYDTNRFYSFLVDSTGVIKEPVITEIGSSHSPITNDEKGIALGCMKASPKGKKIAVGIQYLDLFEIFDFNDSTGILSNHVLFPNNYNGAYGIEFSPNERFLYGSLRSSNLIYQWDLTAENIPGSETIIGTTSTPNGTLQTGPDGKIYLAAYSSHFLHVINDPNRKGSECNFVEDAIYLEGQRSWEGLPNFIASFNSEAAFKYTNFCMGDTTHFILLETRFIDSLLWDFGLGDSGSKGFSAVKDTFFIYPKQGEYNIKLLTSFIDGKMDSVKQKIHIYNYPQLSIGNDTSICEGLDYYLDSGEGINRNYLWNNGWRDRQLNITESGQYSVKVTENACSAYDTVFVEVIPSPIIQNINIKPSNCNENTGEIHFDISGGSNEYSVLWELSPQFTGTDLISISSGLYPVIITDIITNCYIRDSLIVSDYNAPDIKIISDNNPACFGEKITLSAQNGVTYEWNTGDSLAEISIQAEKSERYWVKGSNNQGCSKVEIIDLLVNPVPENNLSEEYEACQGDEIILDAGPKNHSYLWNTGSQNQKLNIFRSGNFSVKLTNEFGCSSLFETSVLFFDKPVVNLGNDTIICAGASVDLNAGDWLKYNWSTGDRVPQISVSLQGIYNVRVTDTNFCEGTAKINLRLNDPENLIIDSVETTDVICGGNKDGTLNISAHGSSGPLLYSIDDGNTFHENNGFFLELPAGELFSVVVKEAGACIQRGQSYSLTEPPVLNLSSNTINPSCPGCSDGSIDISASGGRPPFSYLWSDNSSDNELFNLEEGRYSVRVTDALNCSKVYTSKIIYNEGTYLNIPTAFTPNEDGINDLWKISNRNLYPEMRVKVFGFNGKELFESPPGYPVPWNGKYNGELLPVNSYLYIIEPGKDKKTLTGVVTIVR